MSLAMAMASHLLGSSNESLFLPEIEVIRETPNLSYGNLEYGPCSSSYSNPSLAKA